MNAFGHRLVQVSGGLIRHYIDDALRAEFPAEHEANYRKHAGQDLPATIVDAVAGALAPAPVAVKKPRKARK